MVGVLFWDGPGILLGWSGNPFGIVWDSIRKCVNYLEGIWKYIWPIATSVIFTFTRRTSCACTGRISSSCTTEDLLLVQGEHVIWCKTIYLFMLAEKTFLASEKSSSCPRVAMCCCTKGFLSDNRYD